MPDATSLHHCLKNKRIELRSINSMHTEEGCGSYLHMTDHTPMQLEKHYTCCIERRWHILYNPTSAGLLVSNAWIQLKIVQYWWCYWRHWCRDVASGIDRHPDRTEIYFRLQIHGNQKLILVSVLLLFIHPSSPVFHFKWFCYNYNNYFFINFFW